MLCKNKKTNNLFSTGNSFSFKGEDFKILTPLPSAIFKGEGAILISEKEFYEKFVFIDSTPLIFHVREYSYEMPFACIVMTDPKTYYFSKVHPKDSYNKKVAVKTALANKSFTQKELIDYVENLSYRKTSKNWSEYKKETLLEKIRELPSFSREFFLKRH